MVLVSGNRMGGSDTHITSKVRPGKTIDVEVDMVSPAANDTYTGNWKLKSKTEKFGDGGAPFKAVIRVVASAHGTIYNFANHFCTALWKSSRTQNYLHCPGKIGTNIGYVVKINSPHMENGEFSQPGILTHPPFTDGGVIWGTFPALIIQPGDRFVTEIACLHNYQHCNVEFDLYYQIYDSSEKVSLGHWIEAYDGSTTNVDIDLSFLASQYVALIFKVTGYGNHTSDNAAFWYMPRIHRP